MNWIKSHLFPLLLLMAAVFAVYARSLGHDFLSNWDDNRYILENPVVHGFSLEGIKTVFSRYYVGNYAPLHLISYMLDYSLWGLWPGGYLLANILLHTGNGLLLYHLLTRLLEGRLGPLFGAAVFLLHPVQVESVAWISQRKNLLAMFFFLVAWECYLAYRDNSSSWRRPYYCAAVISFVCALLAKSVAVIFPLVILCLDHCYPPVARRFTLLDKLPFFLAAAAAAVVAIISQTPDYMLWNAGGGRADYHGGSMLATMLTMLPVLCRYLWLLVWPVGLSASYSPAIHQTPDIYVVGAAALLAVMLLLCFRAFRREKGAGFWVALFFIGLLPVAQIVPLITLMNDRYLYFPLLGVAGVAAVMVNKVYPDRLETSWQRNSFLLIPLVLLAVISFQRTGCWRNSVTLWRDTVKKQPQSSLLWEALGEALHYGRRPDPGEAGKAYLRAIELNPESDISRYNLGVAQMALKEYAKADETLRELLRRRPGYVIGWSAYGDLALLQNDYKTAEQRFRKALELQPEAVPVLRTMGNMMTILGRLGEARNAFVRIEALTGGADPVNAYELARVEALAGDPGAALHWLEQALGRGYDNYAGIMADEKLSAIVSDARFASLMNRYFPQYR